VYVIVGLGLTANECWEGFTLLVSFVFGLKK